LDEIQNSGSNVVEILNLKKDNIYNLFSFDLFKYTLLRSHFTSFEISEIDQTIFPKAKQFFLK